MELLQQPEFNSALFKLGTGPLPNLRKQHFRSSVQESFLVSVCDGKAEFLQHLLSSPWFQGPGGHSGAVVLQFYYISLSRTPRFESWGLVNKQ